MDIVVGIWVTNSHPRNFSTRLASRFNNGSLKTLVSNKTGKQPPTKGQGIQCEDSRGSRPVNTEAANPRFITIVITCFWLNKLSHFRRH